MVTLSLEKRAVQPASHSLEMDNKLVFCNAGKLCAILARKKGDVVTRLSHVTGVPVHPACDS